MTRLLHTCSKIFFNNPYVVRIEYLNDLSDSVIEADYRKVTRRAYKLIHGTWGYSKLVYEMVHVKNDHDHTFPPGPKHFTGMSQSQILSTLFDPDWQNIRRGYFCFNDEVDALQFRLSIDTRAIHVVMWPSNITFTIHEMTEMNK